MGGSMDRHRRNKWEAESSQELILQWFVMEKGQEPPQHEHILWLWSHCVACGHFAADKSCSSSSPLQLCSLGKRSRNMVGSWHSAGRVLTLNMQDQSWACPSRNISCSGQTQVMPRFVTHFYSTSNMDTFLLEGKTEEGKNREVMRQIQGNGVNWDSKTQSCCTNMGTASPCPLTGSFFSR